MADITNAINKFKTSVNGEDVRDGFVETMTLVNNDNIKISEDYAQIIIAAGQVGSAVSTATASATIATNKATEAANSAATAAVSATTASTKASQAADSAATATTKATTATTKANEATSAATTVIGIRDEIEPKLDGIDQSVASANSAASTAVAAKDATMQKAAEAVISAATATDQAAVATARATQAATSASAASGSELGAATSATTATQKAAQASDHATAAATSATEAGAKATEAAGSAGTAQASATTATQKAAQASDHATAAATSATEAGAKATEAAGSATAAQEAATTATTKAGEAGDSAAAAAASAAAAELATGVTAEKIASWDAKEDAANKGVAGGYAALDETGKVPAAQLPVMDGHTHTNKAILDKITTGTKASYDLDNFGDMKKAVYDANENGIVDNAEKVNGHTVESDVPAGAKFTDTTYAVATQTTDGLFGATDKIKLDGIVGTGVMTAAEILTEIKTVDGSGSGLDADKLDGKDATEFAPASHGVHVTFGTGVTTLTSGGAGTTGVAESLSRSDHTHTLPVYPDLAGHAGNAGIHVTLEKQTEWNQNTTDIAALYGQTGTLGANDAAARREIIDMKIKLDEMNVAEFLNKTGIGFFDIFEDTSYIDTANTTATVASGDATFAGSKVLQMKQQTYEGFTEVELAIYDMERTLFAVDVAVNNSSTINMNITPGSRTVGEKFWYNGEIYTITGVTGS
ncbi:Uncharacterised protein [Acetobacterium wieringae]|uniref:hypothetical protein n=1 Tax=Acetobacterium wieringae TaxID=52694 RepID=UPI001D55F3BF|nr:hypothetical protein [Acetobacterium wieringae]VUZ25700.1 Uncharacterised protein [Acetobacterium wieringae]